MRARNWLVLTILLIFAVSGAIAGLNMAIDLYGLYRGGRGRRLAVYGDPRVAKYLLSARYVPENFNAILVGSSVSNNWNLAGIQKLRVYNESLNGGNIVEEKDLVYQALARPGITAALVIVHPFLTHSHEYETVRLEPQLRFAALGSQELWEAYKEQFKIRYRRGRVYDNGTEDFPPTLRELNPTLKQMFATGADFEIDPVAVAAYRDVLAALRAHHVRIMYVMPPVWEELWVRKQQAFDRYHRLVEADRAPGDSWVDFTGEPYARFRKERSNFYDGVHLVPHAAEQVVAWLNAAVNRWIE